jgi:hypothetical protein
VYNAASSDSNSKRRSLSSKIKPDTVDRIISSAEGAA